ncbi:MAG TPA: Stp1/IreP family PP2C-type Ser/Thr phosphatase [Candidatus Hydrogenedens sp.]|nr:Stp1/IreP family PP2C-type Ser/Thr phosphatase [Candidatus Hydrogenedens sp.]
MDDFQQNILKEIGPKNEKRYIFDLSNGNIEVCMISDIGTHRTNNEDRCLFSKHEIYKSAVRLGILTAVADGMGGAAAGEHASEMAVNLLSDYYFNSEEENIPKILLDSIQKINSEIFNLGENNPTYFGMGTTISVLVLHGDIGYAAQVGDSRIYLNRPGYPIKQVTEDHSIVAEQLRDGLITAEEARNHSLKNLITRALGIKETVEVDLYSFTVKIGDTILLCSDGLSNIMTEKRLQQSLLNEKLNEGLTSLVDNAIEEDAPDNITAVAIRIIGPLERYNMSNHEGLMIISPEGRFPFLRKLFHLFSKK